MAVVRPSSEVIVNAKMSFLPPESDERKAKRADDQDQESVVEAAPWPAPGPGPGPGPIPGPAPGPGPGLGPAGVKRDVGAFTVSVALTAFSD